MNVAHRQRESPAQAVAGLMASAALFVSLIAVVYRPFRIAPVTILVALIAVGIGGRHERLAIAALVVGTLCWFVGMTLAILLERPLF